MDDFLGVANLYCEEAPSPLFHYTSLGGALSIVPSARLFATELRYLNDTSEGSHLATLVVGLVTSFLATRLAPAQLRMLRQFHPWIKDRMCHGYMVFSASFTTRGDQLSQWRGYCPPGKGISLGFDPSELRHAAMACKFQLGRCIYDALEQASMARKVVEWLLAHTDREEVAPSKRHPNNSFHDLFESIEAALLQASALVKNPAFKEEQEWRVVSQAQTSYRQGSPIRFREGASMLVPYLDFELPRSPGGGAALAQVFVGPTPHPEVARESIHRFLSSVGSYPHQHIRMSTIPYRAW